MTLKKFNYELLFIIVMISPILSLLLDKTSFYNYLAPIITVILFLISILEKKFYSLLLVLIGILCVLNALFITEDSGKVYIHFFSFMNTVLLFNLFSDFKIIDRFRTFFNKHKKTLVVEVLIIWLVEALLIVLHKGFLYRYSWGGSFFLGTSQMPHTMAYLMMMTIIIYMCLLISAGRKFPYYFLFAVPFLAIYLSGARVVLAATLGLSLVIVDYIFTSNHKSIMFKITVYSLFVLLFILIFHKEIVNSNLWQKIILRQNSGNNSAGRSYMIQYMLPNFISDTNPLHILLGQGDDRTYLYNLQNIYVNSSVWAHDDILQILIGKGILGLVIYILSFFHYIRFMFMNKNMYVEFILLAIILGLMFINGFYTYRDTSLGIPYISLLLVLYGDMKKEVSVDNLRQEIE